MLTILFHAHILYFLLSMTLRFILQAQIHHISCSFGCLKDIKPNTSQNNSLYSIPPCHQKCVDSLSIFSIFMKDPDHLLLLSFFFFGDKVSLCCLGWSAVPWFLLTATGGLHHDVLLKGNSWQTGRGRKALFAVPVDCEKSNLEVGGAVCCMWVHISSLQI